MRRFSRRREGQGWVQSLPDRFTIHDVLAAVPNGHVSSALTWLYDGIERGRLQPEHDGDRLLYTFIGGRRAADAAARDAEATQGVG